MTDSYYSSNDPVVIVAAKRTPIGAFNGGLKSLPAHALGSHVIRGVIAESGLTPSDVDELVMGQILTAGAGQNPARQAALAAGIPHEKTALMINQVCGAGLRAVVAGMQNILLGDATIVIAGGQENMSAAPHCAHLRDGTKMGNLAMTDTMISEGLWDAFHDYHMGITAENLAERFSISREDQDVFAATSQQRTEAATKTGKFTNEILPVTVPGRKEDVLVEKDEFPRAGVTAESLARLRPAFTKDGTVTAGNASGINDGAAALLLMRASDAKKRNLPIFAAIKSWATAGVDPALMGTGPIPAVRKALGKAGWTVSDLDLIESNEAFAAQALCVIRELGFAPEKTNVNGGAIALGHPLGASG
ncbi:MAG: acetyl-CoA C-acetyltransferase, partial [Alphaproteobacteria bacterium]|nr:acetyl-CoA C-acetyltransferase [Alphaproteobacteria bacterium]